MPWAFSQLEVRHAELRDAMTESVSCSAPDYAPQEIANSAWSIARSAMEDPEPLRNAISAAALRMLSEFSSHDLTFTAWSCAKIRFDDHTFRDAISASALALISEYGAPDLANTVWAFAKLGITDKPLLNAISSEALRKLSQY